MKILYRVFYILRDARDGLIRHPGPNLATALMLALALFVLSGFLLVDRQLEGIAALLESQGKVRAFLVAEADPWRAAEIAQTIPGVATVRVETAEEALDRFRRAFPGSAEFLEAFDRNPFPNALLIEPSLPEETEHIASALARLEAVAEVVWPQQFLADVLALASALRSFGYLGLAVLFGIAFLVATIAVHLNALHRRDEIDIRLLVGAAPSEVRIQFVLEAVVIGALGGFLGSLGGWNAGAYIFREFQRILPVLPGPPEDMMGTFLGWGVVLGSLLTFWASLAATYRSIGRKGGEVL